MAAVSKLGKWAEEASVNDLVWAVISLEDRSVKRLLQHFCQTLHYDPFNPFNIAYFVRGEFDARHEVHNEWYSGAFWVFIFSVVITISAITCTVLFPYTWPNLGLAALLLFMTSRNLWKAGKKPQLSPEARDRIGVWKVMFDDLGKLLDVEHPIDLDRFSSHDLISRVEKRLIQLVEVVVELEDRQVIDKDKAKGGHIPKESPEDETARCNFRAYHRLAHRYELSFPADYYYDQVRKSKESSPLSVPCEINVEDQFAADKQRADEESM